MLHKLKKLLVSIYEWIHPKVHHVKHMLQIRFLYRLSIMSSEDTINYILKNRCSIARYGDGEFSQILFNYNIGFQQHNASLSQKLLDALKNPQHNLLICVPKYFVSLRKCNQNAKDFWIGWGKKENQQVRITTLLRHHCGRRYRFGDALITRPYIDLKSKKHAAKIFPLLKQLWDGRDLLIVEGSQSRLGVGNDLFANATSIHRILGPAKNAFDAYDELKQAVLQNYTGQLVLLALGPAATAMAAELSKEGIQALDIGHIDIEYEWYLQGATEKVQISGKFTNEVSRSLVETPRTDSAYLDQIVYCYQSTP